MVRNDSVRPVTYVAQAGSATCAWERHSTRKLLTRDVGRGQRIAKVQSTDYVFWSSTSCGTWTQYYPRMVTTRASTATHGVYAVGDHLERGTYVTAGPKDPNIPCYYAFTKGFYGGSGVIGDGYVTDAQTVRMPSGATGFETAGCSWRRVS
jgi:hypothetical protein